MRGPHSVKGCNVEGKVPLWRLLSRDFEGCKGCGADGPQYFCFCMGRALNSDRVEHCLMCGLCYYTRPGVEVCQYCQHRSLRSSEGPEEVWGESEEGCAEDSSSPEGPLKMARTDFGFSSEGYWGF